MEYKITQTDLKRFQENNVEDINFVYDVRRKLDRENLLYKILTAVQHFISRPDVIKLLRAFDLVKEDNMNLTCSFCNEDGFDLVGLKFHLINYCDKYKELDEGGD